MKVNQIFFVNSFDNAARQIYFPIFALAPINRFCHPHYENRHAHRQDISRLGAFVHGPAIAAPAHRERDVAFGRSRHADVTTADDGPRTAHEDLERRLPGDPSSGSHHIADAGHPAAVAPAAPRGIMLPARQ